VPPETIDDESAADERSPAPPPGKNVAGQIRVEGGYISEALTAEGSELD
jgi:hypothetical protein